MTSSSQLATNLRANNPQNRSRNPFFDHLIAGGWVNFATNRPTWPISSHFGWSGRRAQLFNYSRQPSSNLLRTRLPLSTLPGSQHCQAQVLRQLQLVVYQTNDSRPQFKLSWVTQPGVFPQQILFVKAIAVLNPLTPFVIRPDLGQYNYLSISF